MKRSMCCLDRMESVLSQPFPHCSATDSAQTRDVAGSDCGRQQSVPLVRKDDVLVLLEERLLWDDYI